MRKQEGIEQREKKSTICDRRRRRTFLAAVSHDTLVGVGGPACVGLEERWWGWAWGDTLTQCVCVCVCLCVPGLLCDIVENPPKRFPVGLHYQASLIDQLFPPTSCLTSSPSTRLPLPHSSQSHESPLPRRGQGLDWWEWRGLQTLHSQNWCTLLQA